MMFSIIIPVYNAEKYLRPCLDSVLNQTEPDWECICVDDGSKDSSGRILDEYASKDARFKIVHQKNQGVSAARNAALKIAKGDWITWLDADDAYSLTRLELAREIIVKDDPELVRFRTCFCVDTASVQPALDDKRGIYQVLNGYAAKIWGWRVLAPAGMVWTWVAKRELLAGLSFPVGMRIKEDSIYCGMIANRLNKVVQSEFEACYYRQTEQSAIHGVRRADDCVRLLQSVKELYRTQLPLRKEVGEAVFGAMIRWLRVHSESDIIDWVYMRRGEKNRNCEIHALYDELRKLGICDCPCILQRRLRLPFRLWDDFDLMWPIALVKWTVEIVMGVLWKCKRH